jgi:hypothetical protein
MKRKSFEFNETKKIISLQVETFSPTKWLLIDRETGEMYQGNPAGHWDKLQPKLTRDKS